MLSLIEEITCSDLLNKVYHWANICTMNQTESAREGEATGHYSKHMIQIATTELHFMISP
jgi:hypothetical protein